MVARRMHGQQKASATGFVMSHYRHSHAKLRHSGYSSCSAAVIEMRSALLPQLLVHIQLVPDESAVCRHPRSLSSIMDTHRCYSTGAVLLHGIGTLGYI